MRDTNELIRLIFGARHQLYYLRGYMGCPDAQQDLDETNELIRILDEALLEHGAKYLPKPDKQ